MTIWRMRLECWMPEATNTHTHTQNIQYLLFSTETMVARKLLNVASYIVCLLCYNRDGECLLRGTDWVF
jgi:hypothetical protein